MRAIFTKPVNYRLRFTDGKSVVLEEVGLDTVDKAAIDALGSGALGAFQVKMVLEQCSFPIVI